MGQICLGLCIITFYAIEFIDLVYKLYGKGRPQLTPKLEARARGQPILEGFLRENSICGQTSFRKAEEPPGVGLLFQVLTKLDLNCSKLTIIFCVVNIIAFQSLSYSDIFGIYNLKTDPACCVIILSLPTVFVQKKEV